MSTTTTEGHPPKYDLTPSEQVAVANAGTAIVAVAAGVVVHNVSVVGIRDLDLTPPPPLADAVDYPASVPTEVIVRLLLAGERAVASVWRDPQVARLSQFKPATTIARRVLTTRSKAQHQPNHTNVELDRCREHLDNFFGVPEHARHLEWIAHLGMTDHGLDDELLRLVIFDGRCGALSDDGRYRCTMPPHHDEDHTADTFGHFRRVTWPAYQLHHPTTAPPTQGDRT